MIFLNRENIEVLIPQIQPQKILQGKHEEKSLSRYFPTKINRIYKTYSNVSYGETQI